MCHTCHFFEEKFQDFTTILSNCKNMVSRSVLSIHTSLDFKHGFLHGTKIFSAPSSHVVDDVEQADLLENFGVRIFCHSCLKMHEKQLLVLVSQNFFVFHLSPAFFFIFFEQTKEELICFDEIFVLGDVYSSCVFEVSVQSSLHCLESCALVLFTFFEFSEKYRTKGEFDPTLHC